MGRGKASLLFLITSLFILGIVSAAYAEQTEITYFYSGVDSVYEEIVRNFERENPDIKVNLIAGNQLNYGRGIDPIVVLVAGGTPPDVVVMELGWYMPLAGAGILENLLPYLEPDAEWQAMKSDFFYNVAEGFITPQGGLHGMPIDINLRMLFYNRDHFDAAGLEYPRDDWSWDEFHSAARTLTQVGLDGSVQRYGTNPFHGPPSQWLTWVHGNGGRIVDRMVEPTRSTFGTDPAVRQTFHDMVELIHTYRAAPPPGANANFAAGRSSMNLNWMEMIHTYETQFPNLNYAMAPQPVLKDPYTAMGVRLVGVTAASPKKEAAYRLVKYFATSDTAQKLLSIRRVVWKSSVAMDRETLNNPPDINKISVIYAIQHASPIYPLSVDWDEMQAFYESNLGPVWRLEMPFEAVAEIIDRGINAILSDGR